MSMSSQPPFSLLPHIREKISCRSETGHESSRITCSGDPDSGFPVGTISKTIRLSVDRSLSGYHRTGFIEIIPGSIRRLVPAGHHVTVRIKPVPASADLLPLVLTPEKSLWHSSHNATFRFCLPRSTHLKMPDLSEYFHPVM